MQEGVGKRAAIIWGLTIFLLLNLIGSVRAESVTLKLNPAVVEINSFYQGCEVAITGTIPAGHEAVAEIVGPTGEEILMRKGRRGPLWMNVGELKISGAPSLYLILASASDLLTGAASWGFGAMRQRITVAGQVPAGQEDKLRDQFLRLKESEELYAEVPEGLKVLPAKDGRLSVTGSFWLPANVKPDTYTVCLMAVAGDRLVERQCMALSVKMVGFPALFMSLAYQHSVIYGVLAVVIAILTGFIMGHLFKGGGGH
ncbi:MAG TPA: hypothetical protein DCY27_01815 [Desulfobacterales bacterium]|nr:hypothetical protein [Desulfobacterales bacterium]